MMATFFGEVLPVRSRAVDDDDDEEEQPFSQNLPVIHFSKRIRAELEKSGEKKIPCSNFIVAIGAEANAFTEIYVKQFSYEIVGGIFTSVPETDFCTISQTSPTDKTCYIHRCHSNPSIIICQCNKDVLPEESFHWAQLLFDHIDLSQAYTAVLATNSTANYSSEIPTNDLETPFLRALKSSKFVGSPICKILEQPNMLTGLPAQLMTFFQAYQSKAVIYVCYKNNKHLDITDVKCFMPVLEATPIKDITEPNKKAEEMLRDVVELHAVHDTLYI